MDIILYPTTVKMLASEIIQACNAYKSRNIDNNELKKIIEHYANEYPDMLFDEQKLNPTILNRIGKKREKLVNKMLENYQYKIIN